MGTISADTGPILPRKKDAVVVISVVLIMPINVLLAVENPPNAGKFFFVILKFTFILPFQHINSINVRNSCMSKLVQKASVGCIQIAQLVLSSGSKSSGSRYHVPRAWLQADENTLVLFEEVGGNPSLISIATRSPNTVCAHVSDSHPPLVDKWVTSSSSFDAQSQRALVPHVRLECAVHQQISLIVFASFGSSSGTCGSYSEGDCHASSSRAVVEKVSFICLKVTSSHLICFLIHAVFYGYCVSCE